MAKSIILKQESGTHGRVFLRANTSNPDKFWIVENQGVGNVLKEHFPFQQMAQAYITYVRCANGKNFQ